MQPAVVELDGSLLRLLLVGLDVVQVLDAEVAWGGTLHLLPSEPRQGNEETETKQWQQQVNKAQVRSGRVGSLTP